MLPLIGSKRGITGWFQPLMIVRCISYMDLGQLLRTHRYLTFMYFSFPSLGYCQRHFLAVETKNEKHRHVLTFIRRFIRLLWL